MFLSRRAAAGYQAASPALARLLRDDIATTYGKDLPSAVACLNDDFEARIAHLRFPLGHRRVIRTTDEVDKPFRCSLAEVGVRCALGAMPAGRQPRPGCAASRNRRRALSCETSPPA